jgi:hypothetical protein
MHSIMARRLWDIVCVASIDSTLALVASLGVSGIARVTGADPDESRVQPPLIILQI